jgi:uncharacterized metal-binding protein YceD (DUF177 family)
LILGTLKTYQIDLKSLLPTTHYVFHYTLGNDFFESVDGPEVQQGNTEVSLSVVRVSSAFELDFHINGIVTVSCDRCLDDMEVSIKTKNRLIVTFGEAYAETSDEHVIVSEEEGFINVAWYMYEFIALAIPIKHVHALGGCNEMMTSKLNELCVEAVGDEEGSCHKTDEEEEESDTATRDHESESFRRQGHRPVDPRWNALRNLMRDN